MSVFGFDLSEGMVEIARRENPTGDFRVLDLERLDEIKGSFDAVLAVAVLLRLPRQELKTRIRQLMEQVRPGAFLYILAKERREDRPLECVVAEDHLGIMIERFFRYYTQEEVESAVGDLGMEIVLSEVAPSGRARWIEVTGRENKA